MISRPAIVVLLAVYYFQQKDALQERIDGAMLLFYLTIIASDIAFLDSPSQNVAIVLWLIVANYFLQIFIVLNESTFHIKNQRRFYSVLASWIILYLIIYYFLVGISLKTIPNAVLSIELGIICTLALYRKANKKSFEWFVVGTMLLVLSLLVSLENVKSYEVAIEILDRTAYSVGHLLITFGILQSFVLVH